MHAWVVMGASVRALCWWLVALTLLLQCGANSQPLAHQPFTESLHSLLGARADFKLVHAMGAGDWMASLDRFAHLMDSQVCLAVVTKGRSSSRRLNRVLRKVAALLVATGSYAIVGYVSTGVNPADGPSRLIWGPGRAMS